MNIEDRSYFENKILEYIPEIQPLSEKHIDIINGRKNGRFGLSYSAFLLYCHGNSEGFESENYGQGFIYQSEGMIAGIGIFQHPTCRVWDAIHIVAPNGPNWLAEVNQLRQNLRAICPATIIYVRHLEKHQREALIDYPWDELTYSEKRWSDPFIPWLPEAPEEDETIPCGRIVTLTRMFADDKSVIRSSMAEDAYRSIERRFPNFQSRNRSMGIEIEYVLEPYCTEAQKSDAREVIFKHFTSLEGKLVGSKPTDYLNLIEHIPAPQHREFIHAYIGYLQITRNGSTEKVPVSFFVFEDINNPLARKLSAGYSTITRRGNSLAKELDIDCEGLSALPTYAFCQVFRELRFTHNVQAVDLGASELVEMANFKTKFQNPSDFKKDIITHARKTGWVSYR